MFNIATLIAIVVSTQTVQPPPKVQPKRADKQMVCGDWQDTALGTKVKYCEVR